LRQNAFAICGGLERVNDGRRITAYAYDIKSFTDQKFIEPFKRIIKKLRVTDFRLHTVLYQICGNRRHAEIKLVVSGAFFPSSPDLMRIFLYW